MVFSSCSNLYEPAKLPSFLHQYFPRGFGKFDKISLYGCTLLFIRNIRSTSRTLFIHVCDHSRPHKFTLYSKKAKIGMNVDTWRVEVAYYCIEPQAQLLVDDFYFTSYKFWFFLLFTSELELLHIYTCCHKWKDYIYVVWAIKVQSVIL